MTTRCEIWGIAVFLASALPITHAAHAADYIAASSARSSSYEKSYVGFAAEDCSNLLISDDSGGRVVRLCHPPLDLDPRGNFQPGSSGGSNITYGDSFTIVN